MRKRIYIRKNGTQIIKYYDYKQYDDLYYKEHKAEKLQKVKCTCGLEICKIVLNRHKRTVKHVFAMLKIFLNRVLQ